MHHERKRFFRHTDHTDWGLGQLLEERRDRAVLRFQDGTRRVMALDEPGLVELSATDVLVAEHIQKEVERFGTVCPPHVKYPHIPRGSIGWRMGAGEFYVWMYNDWTANWSSADRLADLAAYAPLPIAWTWRAAEALKVEDPWQKPAALPAIIESGLLDRSTAPKIRSFDHTVPITPGEATQAVGGGARRYAEIALAVAMTTEDVEFATRYCVEAARSESPRVRANAVLGLGHIARRHGVLNRSMAEPVFDAAAGDDGRDVKIQAECAALDVSYHAGWDPMGR